MKKRTIAFDANGVVFDHAAKVRALMYVTGIAVPMYQFNGRQSAIEHGVHEEQYDEAMYVLFETDRFFSLMVPAPGALEALTDLDAKGCHLVMVSCCKGITEEKLFRLSQRHNLPIHDAVLGQASKLEWYAMSDVAIDDESSHFESVHEHGTRPILMLPSVGGTGYEAVRPPRPLDRRIRIARGWVEARKHIPELKQAA